MLRGLIMAGPKIVKRYANRKLYDTERSCYVTLDDISLMIRSGEDVTVIDNKSGEDLTSVTLAQIIFETEKKKHFMPLNLLRGLIQNSGQFTNQSFDAKILMGFGLDIKLLKSNKIRLDYCIDFGKENEGISNLISLSIK